jgi:type I restriction enzyme S subunit
MKNGWKIIPMGSLCSIKSGKSDTKDAVEGGPYAFFDRSRTIKRSSRFLYNCEALIIPGEGTEFLPKHFIGKFDLHQRAYALFGFSPQIDVKFLYFFLHHLCDYFPRVAVGATVKSLRLRHFEELPVSVTSLPEQKRIVGILDKAFKGIATAKANAEKNLQNARALFESHLQSVFAVAWQTYKLVTLSDLATDITDGDHLPPPKAPTGVPFITIGNIMKDTRKIDFTDTFMVPHAYFNGLKDNKKPRKGDLLYTVTGSFGIPVIVDHDVAFCFQRHIGLIRPKLETNSAWLYYLLLSPQVFKQANERATGTAQRTVSLKELRGFIVPNVPMPQQRAVVAKLNLLSDETQRLESIYQRKLAMLEALRKSLLHQAFTGAL